MITYFTWFDLCKIKTSKVTFSWNGQLVYIHTCLTWNHVLYALKGSKLRYLLNTFYWIVAEIGIKCRHKQACLRFYLKILRGEESRKHFVFQDCFQANNEVVILHKCVIKKYWKESNVMVYNKGYEVTL